MPENLIVVYAARTLQDAHLLRNLLADAGIHAVVSNDLLQGGSGSTSGMAGLSRVLSATEDAPRAREIALEFDRRVAPAAAKTPPARRSCRRRHPPPWPKCPQCGAAADDAVPGLRRPPAAEFPAADADPSGVLRRMCSTCDEPFVPEYPRRCEWCGHEFADGYDVGPDERRATNRR